MKSPRDLEIQYVVVWKMGTLHYVSSQDGLLNSPRVFQTYLMAVIAVLHTNDNWF